jgi:hypothetical protein
MNLTAEEVQLILSVSEMDCYKLYHGGPDFSETVCPLCCASIDHDSRINAIIDYDEFFKITGLERSEWSRMYVYSLTDEQIKMLPVRHLKDCKIQKLKTIKQKMLSFLDEIEVQQND